MQAPPGRRRRRPKSPRRGQASARSDARSPPLVPAADSVQSLLASRHPPCICGRDHRRQERRPLNATTYCTELQSPRVQRERDNGRSAPMQKGFAVLHCGRHALAPNRAPI
jgi:hypothetical protein